MKFRILLFLCCLNLLAAGCAHAPSSARPASPPSSRAFGSDDEEMTYHVLMGELAVERSDSQTAAREYLAAARVSTDAGLAERAALLAYAGHDEATAYAAAQRWQTLAPHSVDAAHFVAVLDARLGKWDEAAAQFESLVKAGADKSYSVAAGLLEQETDSNHGLPVLERIVQDANDSADAHFALAHAAFHYRHYADAAEQARTAFKLSPQLDDALVLQCRALVALGRIDEALPMLQARVRAAPDKLALHLAYAALLAEAKRNGAARAEFEVILKTHPGEMDALYTLGLLALQDKDFTAAHAYFKRLLETGKRNDDAYYYLGNTAETAKRYPEALDWYRKVGDGERWLGAQAAIGRTLVENGTPDVAMTFFDQLVSGDPDDFVSVRLTEAQMFSDLGDRQRAMQVYNAALGDEPDNNDLLYGRALLLERDGRADAAVSDLKAILKHTPDDADALNALGYTLTLHSKAYGEAREYIQKALGLQPDDAAIMDSMGWVEYRMGDYPAALSYLRKAYDLMADPEIAAHLVEVLWHTGDKQAARALWSKETQAHSDSDALRGLSSLFNP